MRCHTWPPAASDLHMGVRTTMSDPPSPAPGWHILIHERAWALSGQNYPYQNATINTFINPTPESNCFLFPLQKNLLLVICICPLTVPLTGSSLACTHTSKHLTRKFSFHWSLLITVRSNMSVCHWSGTRLLLKWLSESPRCWWACPLTYWPKSL